jgi:P27 family predicted phage terminase small subunit
MVVGRPPKPTHLKLLRGNPGKRALNKNEPKPQISADLPEPPIFLSGYGLEEWNRIGLELHRLRLLTVVDINTLAAYCEAYARWRTAEETLKRLAVSDPMTHGLLIKSTANTPMPNPLVWVAHKAAAAMVKYGAEFGLTPAARSRIAATDADKSFKKKFEGLIAS